VEILLEWRKFIKTSFMTCHTSKPKEFFINCIKDLRWGRRRACSTYGEKSNACKILAGKTEGKSLRRPKCNGRVVT